MERAHLVIGGAIVGTFALGVGVGWSLHAPEPRTPDITSDRAPMPRVSTSASTTTKPIAPKPEPHDPLAKVCVPRSDPEVFTWPTPEPLGGEFLRVDATHFMLDRGFVDRVVEDQAELMRSARIVPQVDADAGKVIGIRLFGVRPGTLLDAIGFENGDLMSAMNGCDMSNPEAALEVYANLRTEKQLFIDLERKGAKMTLHYVITGPAKTMGDAGVFSSKPPLMPTPIKPKKP